MWLNPQESADLVTFTEQILNGKLHFLGSGIIKNEFDDYKVDSTVQQSRWICLQEDIFSTKAAIWSYSQTYLGDTLKCVHFTVNFGWLNNIRVTWF